MSKDHIVKTFDDDLSLLDNKIAEMGGLAELQLSNAIDALLRPNAEKAERVILNDQRIDALEKEIDSFTVQLLALRQPMADDLRIIIAALKIASVLERIGDYAKNVAKRTIALSQSNNVGSATSTIARMGNVVQSMIKNVLDAYVSRDVEQALDVWERDEEVDQLHTSLFRELLTYMLEEPRNITACTHLLFIAKNVERIGDHATSIAEQVHFMVRGDMPDLKRPKGDQSSFTVVEAEEGDSPDAGSTA
ncbi:MAG: phosphate signaling complex protein PhoU [Hyphomicrobiales bacterium]|nr:phosphate signaling complex protein PhoU [Hyphomicrobiales bacterium]